MNTLFRESAVGQLLRLVVHSKALAYPEEADPQAYRQFIPDKETEKRPAIHRLDSSGVEDPRNAEDGNEEYGALTLTAQATRVSRIRTQATAESDPESRSVSASKTLTEKDNDSEVVGWSGPTDPDNPQNWPRWKKLAVSAQICYMTFSVYVGAGIYSPSVVGIAEHFHVSTVVATLGLTCFVAGYGLGPMIFAPLGEAPPIGRALIYIVCLGIFVIFQLGVTLSSNIGMLLSFRFLTGFIGSPVLATGGASMADIWHPSVVSYAIGVWGAVAVCGPTLGPLLGGFAVMAEGWKWSIWILMWASGLSFVINLLLLPETSASTILYRRANRIRKITGSDKYRSAAEIEASKVNKKDLLFEALLRPFQLCFTEPVILVLNIYIALIYGILYLFFEAFPIVFQGIYGFNPGEEGIAWLGLFVGATAGTGLYFIWIAKFRNKHVTPQGMKPEEHLPPAMLGGIFLTISLLFFGWVARRSIHWMAPICASALFGAGGSWLINSAFCYLMGAYPIYAASALASNDFMRSMLAAGFPTFGAATFNNLGVDWACTMLGLLTAVFIPAPFLFYKFGGKLRLMSKRANHEMVD